MGHYSSHHESKLLLPLHYFLVGEHTESVENPLHEAAKRGEKLTMS